MPGCSWKGHLRGVHIHYCPDVLGRDTCEGCIFITAWVFLEETPVMGTYGFHYCPGVLRGDTYDGFKWSLVITALKDELRKLKGKALVDNAVTKHTIDTEMLKNDVEPITLNFLNNRTTHCAYIKHTQEEDAVLRDLVEHVKANYLLDHPLESACRYTKRIQDLLINISKTCPSINNSGEKLVAVTPKNKDKRVRFIESVTSSGNTNIKIASSSNLVSNKPMLSSTGVKLSTSASRSKPSGNTKKVKIQQTPRTANVQHSKLNANPKLKCVKCNDCMISDNHDLFVLDFINNVNARIKSKSAKKNSKRKFWKPTGKVLKSVSANKKEPSQSWGSIVSDVPSSPLEECMSSELFFARHGLVRGLPILKFEKDHMCPACAMGKSKQKPHKPKFEDTNQEKFYLLHMDLCGPMRVASVNGKKYILVIIDDYS
ncbi:retrovirus-related pol polyprotein from transposon TNT 1-94 [Tanacetum coccineum]